MRILGVAANIAEDIDNKLQGGTGAYISDIVDQVNAFTKDSKELVVVHLSHAYNFDRPGPHDRNASLTKDEWHHLMSELSRLNDLYNLHNVPLEDFIQGGKAAVVVFIGKENIDLGDCAKKGSYQKQIGRETLSLKDDNFFDPKNKDKPGKLMSFYITHKLNTKGIICAWAYDRDILGADSTLNKLINMGHTTFCSYVLFP